MATPPKAPKKTGGKPKNVKLVTHSEVSEIIKKQFESEKEFCDFVEYNIKELCLELGYDYKEHIREDGIVTRRFGANKPKIDFRIITHSRTSILIECKNPTHVYGESMSAIGQVLGYLQIAKRVGIKVEEVFIVTTSFDIAAIEIIQEHNLPISICMIDRNNLAVWHHGSS